MDSDDTHPTPDERLDDGSGRDDAAQASVAQEAASLGPVQRTLRLRRETVRNLTEDILSSQGHSLWTCDDTRQVPGEPETTYVEIENVNVEVRLDVRGTQRHE